MVALVLAATAGLSVLLLTAAALYDALADPVQAGISEAYSALLTGTLGVVIGALAGYIGGRHDPGDDVTGDTVGTSKPAAAAGDLSSQVRAVLTYDDLSGTYKDWMKP